MGGDYYPFGMLVPNRHNSAESYRYGFNGMEKDDEIKGFGNSYDFGARMLDPRVGRWFAPDKLEVKYPSNSTYSYALNSPLTVVDPDGNDIVIIGNKKYRKQVLQALRDLYNQSPSGRKIVMDLINAKEVFLIVDGRDPDKNPDSYKSYGSQKAEGYIVFNYDESARFPKSEGLGSKELEAPPITNLAHELKHAHDDLTKATEGINNIKIADTNNPTYTKNAGYGTDAVTPEFTISKIPAIEVTTVEFENQVRAELGITLRTHYGGINVFEKKISNIAKTVGTGNKRFTSLTLEAKKFDFKKFNPAKATESFLNDIVKENKWWDTQVKETEEKNINYNFGYDGNYPKPEKEAGALRLTGKNKKDK